VTWTGWVFVGLAGGFVVLAAYGKYQKVREDFHEAQEREAAEREADERRGLGGGREPGPTG